MANTTIQILQSGKSKILTHWMKNQLNDVSSRQEDDEQEQSEEFLNAFIAALNEKSITNAYAKEFDKTHDILASISISRAKQGFSPRETGNYIFNFKEAVLLVLAENIKDKGLLYDETIKFNKLIDNFSISTFETFIKGREDVILRQTDEIAEISTPVIRVWDGILALPIIGTLDSSRTQSVMENLLQEIVETGSTITILDISGVPAVDTLVAQHLIKTVSATRLMGAECIISGIRPEIAQTIVHLGIDLSGIITKPTLASALKASFAILQLEVSKKQKQAIR